MKVAPKTKKWLKAAAKILGSAICLYYLFTQIEWESIQEQLWAISLPGLLLASIFYLASHFLSVKRLGLHFFAENIELSYIRNLRLYFQGMFYSLFLPGIIGGDGYKMYWLKQKKEVPLKQSFRSLLIDRLNGLWAIFLLSAVLISLIDLPFRFQLSTGIVVGTLYYAAHRILKFYFPQYLKVLFPASFYSALIQASLLLCIFCLLWGYGIQEDYLSYGLIFFAGALASVIPISIGGLGFRELTFLYGASYFGLDEGLAVSLSLLFYFITLAVSLIGIAELWKND
ncbi:MAG: lysylphosphatidylglycerol synthase transmembrane domain-containing protein [Bacteroidia bacterium]|nr:lysylphosphatidylglycerol synthase transmembrane domain-containing protein [Bacteroidia bacterium]